MKNMYILLTAGTDYFSARFVNNSPGVLASDLLHLLFILNMEVVKRRRSNSEKSSHVWTISFFNQKVVKNEHDRVSFQI